MLSRMRLARLNRGWSMFTVFTKTKIQPSRQSLIERQLVEPTETEKSKLAKALGEDVALLFPAATIESASDAASASMVHTVRGSRTR